MKLWLKIPALTGLALAFSTTATFNQPSNAEDTTFLCETIKGVPTTIASTSRGYVPMIRWVSSNYFPPPWTPQRRCVEVSQRFQRNYENGTLEIIKTGTLNGETVVCAASSADDDCTDSTLLFTLKRESNANLAVLRLLDRRGLAGGNVLNESACKEDCPITIDVAEYLNKVPVDPNIRPKQSGNTPWWHQK